MATGTLIQKIIDSHFAGGSRHPGETVEIIIDQALTQDATGTLAALEFEAMKAPTIGAPLAVFYVDHNLAQFGPENRNDHLYLASVAAKYGAVFSAEVVRHRGAEMDDAAWRRVASEIAALTKEKR